MYSGPFEPMSLPRPPNRKPFFGPTLIGACTGMILCIPLAAYTAAALGDDYMGALLFLESTGHRRRARGRLQHAGPHLLRLSSLVHRRRRRALHEDVAVGKPEDLACEMPALVRLSLALASSAAAGTLQEAQLNLRSNKKGCLLRAPLFCLSSKKH